MQAGDNAAQVILLLVTGFGGELATFGEPGDGLAVLWKFAFTGNGAGTGARFAGLQVHFVQSSCFSIRYR